MAGRLLPLQFIESVSSGTFGKIIIHECEWAFSYNFFAAGTLWIEISHIFLFKLLKPVFSNLKSKFPLNLKINISGSMQKEDLSNDIILTPVISRLTIPLKGLKFVFQTLMLLIKFINNISPQYFLLQFLFHHSLAKHFI
jgi:hypothetical protein